MNKSRSAVKRDRTINRTYIGAKLFLAAIAAIIVLCGSSILGKTFTATAHGNASEEPVNYKYYKSIEIQSGDTLWDIAKTYMSKEKGATIYDYIEEVKKINSLKSDTIKDSGYLTIPYYEAQFQ